MAICFRFENKLPSEIYKLILDIVTDAEQRGVVGPSARSNHTCQPCLSHEQPIRIRATGRDARNPSWRNLHAAWSVRFRQEHLAQYPGLARPAFGGPVPTWETPLGGNSRQQKNLIRLTSHCRANCSHVCSEYRLRVGCPYVTFSVWRVSYKATSRATRRSRLKDPIPCPCAHLENSQWHQWLESIRSYLCKYPIQRCQVRAARSDSTIRPRGSLRTRMGRPASPKSWVLRSKNISKAPPHRRP